MKYVSRKVKIPNLKLDFSLIAEEGDAEQFDIFWNLMMSLWVQEGRGNKIEVLDHINSMEDKTNTKIREVLEMFEVDTKKVIGKWSIIGHLKNVFDKLPIPNEGEKPNET